MSKLFSKNHILVVGFLLIVALWAVQTCNQKSIVIIEKNVSLAAKTDSIQQAHKQVDSVAKVNQIVGDVAAAVARTNQQQKKVIDSLQDKEPLLVAAIDDDRAAQKFSHDISYLKTDVQLLAAQRDSLIVLIGLLITHADSVRLALAKARAKDSGAGKPAPVFSPSYVIGGKNNTPLPPFKITGQLGVINNFTNRTTSLQVIARQYFQHISVNEFVNLPVAGMKRPVSFSASAQIDLASFEIKKKKK